MSSGCIVTMTFAPAATRSSGGSAGAAADSGLRRWKLEDGESCDVVVVGGWQVWFPPPTSSSSGGAKYGVQWRVRGATRV